MEIHLTHGQDIGSKQNRHGAEIWSDTGSKQGQVWEGRLRAEYMIEIVSNHVGIRDLTVLGVRSLFSVDISFLTFLRYTFAALRIGTMGRRPFQIVPAPC